MVFIIAAVALYGLSTFFLVSFFQMRKSSEKYMKNGVKLDGEVIGHVTESEEMYPRIRAAAAGERQKHEFELRLPRIGKIMEVGHKVDVYYLAGDPEPYYVSVVGQGNFIQGALIIGLAGEALATALLAYYFLAG